MLPLSTWSSRGNRRLPFNRDFKPSTVFVDFSQRTVVSSMGVFGAAVIVKTDLPSLHHLRPLTTEPFVYSHARGFIISVTTRRIGPREGD